MLGQTGPGVSPSWPLETAKFRGESRIMLSRSINGVLLIILAAGLAACEPAKVDCMPLRVGKLAATAPEKITEAQCIASLRTEAKTIISQLGDTEIKAAKAEKRLEATQTAADLAHITIAYDDTNNVVTLTPNEVAAAPVDVPAVDPNAPSSAAPDQKAKAN